MSAWVVVPSLLTLRDEYNRISPKRDKGADGTIGDSNHTSTSDHTPDEDSRVLKDHDADSKNEVHALDIDSTGPWPDGKRGDIAGSWFDKKVHQLIANEKRRWEDPNDMCRLNYIIWRGVIYDKDVDWKGVTYHGTDQHTNHAHFSSRYETRAESDTRPWGVYAAPEEDDVELSDKFGNKAWPTRTLQQHTNDMQELRDVLWGDPKGTAAADLPAGAPIAKLLATPAKVEALEAKLDQVNEAIAKQNALLTQLLSK